ncbi:MAG TPA: hypothetical protein VLC07_04695 [Solirubrobacterales bacterium]|nr:hypothetical protein [Solirubrobacterales bacterium]
MGDVIDLSLTTRSDEELRRLAADGNQDAIAEMARRNRLRVGRAQADPKGHRAPDRRRPEPGYFSTGRKISQGGGYTAGSAGRQVA